MKTSSAPYYDLFKLVVAILLLLIFLFLLLWMPSMQAPQALLPSGTPLPPHSTPTVVSVQFSPAVTSTSVAPTATPAGTNTPNPTSSPTATSTPTQSSVPTSTPSPTKTPTPEATATSSTESPSVTNACGAALRSQLQVGMKATIQHRLNFRSSVGIQNNRLLTNIPGTQVEVVGGPVCTTYQNGVSYLWWQVKLPNGSVGWSAEASAFGGFYFMEPAP